MISQSASPAALTWSDVLRTGPGRQVTYTSPYRWLPGFRPVDGDAALRTLVTRYLYAYGSATPPHFAR